MRRFVAAAFALWAVTASAQITLTQGTNFAVDVSSDGRMAIDLLGTIWVMPRRGGAATSIATGLLPVSRPRWSPSNDAIVYEATSANQTQLWLYRFADQQASRISSGQFFDQHPDWHPDGSRIVYSSDRHDRGFDLWELDLRTGLTWRISHEPGDETEPAWSADGRDLVYVARRNQQWSIVLRRLGQPERTLLTSDERLSAPAWRPDGSLVTFLRHAPSGLSIEMAILSDPVLVRPLVSDEDFFVAPVSWADRQTLVYSAGGKIRQRDFNAWTSRTLPFRVSIERAAAQKPALAKPRRLPVISPPTGQLVIRTARIYDGLDDRYKTGLDIVIDGATITALEPQSERPGARVVELSDLTAVPGYIDSFARLPDDVGESMGPLLLSFGITTLVADSASAAAMNKLWSGAMMPGPRLLRARSLADDDGDELPWLVSIRGDLAAGVERRKRVSDWQSRGVPVLAENWQVGIGSGASMVMGAATLPASPGGRRYDDIELTGGGTPLTIVSGLADVQTPGLAELFNSRNAKLLPKSAGALRRFNERPDVAAAAQSIVLGSYANGMPPGIALHAEFRALKQAGLRGEHILKAGGINAANALHLGLQIGRLAPGSVADIVLVDGDPLAEPASLAKVVGVVRNGRFFSVIGLLDRVQTAPIVE